MARGARRHSPQLTGSCLNHAATFLLGSTVALLVQLFLTNNLDRLRSSADNFDPLKQPVHVDVACTMVSTKNTSESLRCIHPQQARGAHQRILVTGAAGFIGFHTTTALAQQPQTFVLGLDNFNNYYKVSLKRQRQQKLQQCYNVTVVQGDLRDVRLLQRLFQCYMFTHVVHLAAQAGVPASLEHPVDYIVNNEVSTAVLLEVMAQQQDKPILVYASSSSVYGSVSSRAAAAVSDRHAAAAAMQLSCAVHMKQPVQRHMQAEVVGCDTTDSIGKSMAAAQRGTTDTQLQPMPESSVQTPKLTSVYAATKLATEHLVEVYTHQHNLRLTGLRFFTVYGPWGRPDMAVMKFTEALLAGRPVMLTCFPSKGRPVNMLKTGNTSVISTASSNPKQQQLSAGVVVAEVKALGCRLPMRDFTYISDIVDGILLALNKPAAEPSSSHNVYNLGRGQPADVGVLLRHLEDALGVRAPRIEFQTAAAGSPDVRATWADISAATRDLGYRPTVGLRQGIRHFVDWYQNVYQP